MNTFMSSALRLWRWPKLWIVVVIGLMLVGSFQAGITPAARASEPVDVGYRDFYFGTSVSAPTGEKPESKLWFNDGVWWGSLWSPSAGAYHIYRLDLGSQSWVDTGTLLDDRSGSKADALWDAATQKLYLVSHLFTTNAQPSSSQSRWGRLYRYSYEPATKTYSLDAGFPVTVTRGNSETLTVAKDSTGQLWVTYVENSQVMVNRSLGSDSVWGEPLVLPAKPNAVSVASDDISAVVAFQGNKIGVLWSNQLTSKMYFAVHLDGDPDDVWQPEQTALPGPNDCTGACADDHINLKSLQVDGSGRVFAAIKTSLGASSAPLIMLLVRDLNGQWSSHVFGRKSDHHTRPIVLLDEEHGRIYMFATAPEAGGVIYYKTTEIDNINFSLGLGEPFIQSSTDLRINNATSTKQNLSSATGLVVLASDNASDYYFHNSLSLGSTLPTATPTPGASATPAATSTPPPAATNTPTSTPPAAPTSTPTATAAPGGILSFTPTDDAQVKRSRPTSNYGALTALRLRQSSTEDIDSLVKFQVTGLTAPVQRATLRLFVTDGSPDGGAIYAVANSYLNSSTPWTEEGLTWNNAPALTGSPLSSLGSVTTGTWVEFDVTAAIAGDGAYSFRLTSSSSNSVFFNAKEAADNPPVLLIELAGSQ